MSKVTLTRTFKGRQVKRRKGKAKGKGKGGFKGTGRVFLVKHKHKILNGGQKKDYAWWSKGKVARKVFQMVDTTSLKVVFAHTNQKTVQALM